MPAQRACNRTPTAKSPASTTKIHRLVRARLDIGSAIDGGMVAAGLALASPGRASTLSPVRTSARPVPSLAEAVAVGAGLGFSLAAPPGPVMAKMAFETARGRWQQGGLVGLGAMTADATY